jgi:hypothetical protein
LRPVQERPYLPFCAYRNDNIHVHR